jgi:TRAP-type C4-dicarboxylate transport system permease small subunit
MAETDEVREGYHLERPNREKASSRLTKLVVILLLLASAGLILIVTIGGWAKLTGGKPMAIAYIAVYLLMAFFVLRWNRGVLPLAAALAIILGIFAGIGGPEWFNRTGPGYEAPALPEQSIGFLTLIIVPVQVLLIISAIRGFAQDWNTEVEVADGEQYRPDEQGQPA